MTEDKKRRARALRAAGATYREIAALIGVSISSVERYLIDDDFRAPEKQIKQRSCLRCGKTFDSWGPGNRLCSRCAHISVSPFAP